MMNKLNNFFTINHLTENSQTILYEKGLLYFSIALVSLTILTMVSLKLKKRPEVYRKFDQLWGWGLVIFGLAGLFEWFSVDQSLPTFGTRLAVYIWFSALLAFAVFAFLYYKSKTTNELAKFHEKKRKEKYLK